MYIYIKYRFVIHIRPYAQERLCVIVAPKSVD